MPTSWDAGPSPLVVTAPTRPAEVKAAQEEEAYRPGVDYHTATTIVREGVRARVSLG